LKALLLLLHKCLLRFQLLLTSLPLLAHMILVPLKVVVVVQVGLAVLMVVAG
jgi:hypothetical protein